MAERSARFFEDTLTKLELSAATHDNQERRHLHMEIVKIYLEVWNAYRYRAMTGIIIASGLFVLVAVQLAMAFERI